MFYTSTIPLLEEEHQFLTLAVSAKPLPDVFEFDVFCAKDRPTPVPARQAPGPAQIVPARPASRGHAPEVGQAVELLKPEELVERLDPLDLDALIMETQRNLSLYALVSGAELSEEGGGLSETSPGLSMKPLKGQK